MSEVRSVENVLPTHTGRRFYVRAEDLHCLTYVGDKAYEFVPAEDYERLVAAAHAVLRSCEVLPLERCETAFEKDVAGLAILAGYTR